jgi:LPXTG-motif cell wall-anchored protein
VRIADGMLARFSNSLRCGATVLSPGATTTCTSSPYTVTRGNGANGAVRNWATAWAVIAGSSVRSQVTETVVAARPAVVRAAAQRPTAVRRPAKAPVARIALKQWLSRVLDRAGNGRLDVGDGYVYSFKVTNTGGTSVSSVRIHDRRVERAGGSITCGRTHLAPGASTVCTSTVLSVARYQAKNGLGTNYASATAVSPTGRTVHSNATSSTHGLSATADAGADPAASLPRTGSDPWGLLGLAGGLLLAGAGLTRVSRRRDAASDEPAA